MTRAARSWRAPSIAAAAAGVLSLTSCGGDAVPTPPIATVTVVATETETVEAPAPSVSGEGTPAASQTRAVAAPAPQAQLGVVPDVVGVNHQLAQDTMQAAGFYNLSEEDATGQGRLLVVDRNWVVVSQSPPAGTKAAPDVTIVLRSKKLTD
ncbi:PASTA domain-containing protein [Intrasporangium oryzae]|nr:PASTA domain-containing protein [Intrasporangium oryzae]